MTGVSAAAGLHGAGDCEAGAEVALQDRRGFVRVKFEPVEELADDRLAALGVRAEPGEERAKVRDHLRR